MYALLITSRCDILTSLLLLVKLFFGGMAGKWGILFWFQYLGGSGVAELFSVLEMWWLGFWAQQYALRDAGDVQVSL